MKSRLSNDIEGGVRSSVCAARHWSGIGVSCEKPERDRPNRPDKPRWRNVLDKALLKKIKNIVRNETGLGRESISTSDIYDKLVAAGVEVPDQAMTEILTQLEKERLITTVANDTRDGEEKHGACRINWVSRDL